MLYSWFLGTARRELSRQYRSTPVAARDLARCIDFSHSALIRETVENTCFFLKLFFNTLTQVRFWLVPTSLKIRYNNKEWIRKYCRSGNALVVCCRYRYHRWVEGAVVASAPGAGGLSAVCEAGAVSRAPPRGRRVPQPRPPASPASRLSMMGYIMGCACLRGA